MSELDAVMFFLHNSSKLTGIICCHIDDILHAGVESLENIMVNLRKKVCGWKS